MTSDLGGASFVERRSTGSETQPTFMLTLDARPARTA
jgi:hypothetical protein